MPLRRSIVALATALLALPAAATLGTASLQWTQTHAGAGSTPFLSEIVSFEAASRTLWVSGPGGIDVLDVASGARLGFIDTRAFGDLNSVAIHGGLAALAFANASDRRLPGLVVLYDTATRSQLAGTSPITVGALPDMLAFTPDGRRLPTRPTACPIPWAASASSTWARAAWWRSPCSAAWCRRPATWA
jgi:hypothetical protein